MNTMENTRLTAEKSRCFGHIKAKELDLAEINSVAGGASYTGISHFEVLDDNGNVRFDYGDYYP